MQQPSTLMTDARPDGFDTRTAEGGARCAGQCRWRILCGVRLVVGQFSSLVDPGGTVSVQARPIEREDHGIVLSDGSVWHRSCAERT